MWCKSVNSIPSIFSVNLIGCPSLSADDCVLLFEVSENIAFVMTKFVFIGSLKCFSNLVAWVNAQNHRKCAKDKRNSQAVDQNDFRTQNIWPKKVGKQKQGTHLTALVVKSPFQSGNNVKKAIYAKYWRFNSVNGSFWVFQLYLWGG